MSAFENYEKDAIFDSISVFVSNKKKEGVKTSQVISELMDIVSYGIKNGLYESEK